jgi:hypothetical protein
LTVASSAIASLSSGAAQAEPTVSQLVPDISATSGSFHIVLLGAHLGKVEFSSRVGVQRSAALSTAWLSDSVILFRLPQLIGRAS